MEETEFYRRLIQRYREKKATDQELQVFIQLLMEGKLDEYLHEQMEEDEPAVLTGRVSWRKMSAAAASIVLLLLAGWYFYSNQAYQEKPVVQSGTKQENTIYPGSDKAVLTLADGTNIPLDEVTAGEVALQAGVAVVKSADGQLEYQSLSAEENALPKMTYNTLSTSRGGQFRVILPDGTRAWLNAESSIRYPTVFNGGKRLVSIAGEVYFEVKKDKGRPFIVEVNGTSIEVLGTKFNVEAYGDEMTTTLLEGAVKVLKPSSGTARGDRQALLRPGQKAIVSAMEMKVQPADLEKTMAWKDGVFFFRNEKLSDMMLQLARWYDFEVVYKGTHFNRHYSGSIKRNARFTEVLEMLRLVTGAEFEVDGKRVIVATPDQESRK